MELTSAFDFLFLDQWDPEMRDYCGLFLPQTTVHFGGLSQIRWALMFITSDSMVMIRHSGHPITCWIVLEICLACDRHSLNWVLNAASCICIRLLWMLSNQGNLNKYRVHANCSIHFSTTLGITWHGGKGFPSAPESSPLPSAPAQSPHSVECLWAAPV